MQLTDQNNTVPVTTDDQHWTIIVQDEQSSLHHTLDKSWTCQHTQA